MLSEIFSSSNERFQIGGKTLTELSREEKVDYEQVTKSRTLKFYKDINYGSRVFNIQQAAGYIPFENIKNDLQQWFIDIVKLENKALNFVEVAAGNGFASSKLVQYLNEVNTIKNKVNKNDVKNEVYSDADEKVKIINKYCATDLYCHYCKDNYPVVGNLPSELAVREYISDMNVLVMIAPPPGVNVDYYAIKEFELGNNGGNKKYLLIMGELGASDGSIGIWNYLMGENSDWKLLHRVNILKKSIKVMGLTDNVEKDAFLFRYKFSS
jgi:hypothetical protein